MVLKGMEGVHGTYRHGGGVHGTYRHGGGTWYLKAWRGYMVLKGMEGSTWYLQAWRGVHGTPWRGVHGT